ncbi:MAG: hypothetical protein ABIR96_05960 [Bdellovibrionota bacterium]
MPSAVYQFQAVADSAVLLDGASFPVAVNREGTSQVVRISFDLSSYTGAEIVTVPVSVVAGAGNAKISHGIDIDVTSLNLELSAANPVAYLTVAGGSDAGDFDINLATSSSDLGSGDFNAVAPATLHFTNNDNVAQAHNAAPTDPTLKLPLDDASVASTSAVTFEWTHSFDEDKDTLQYDLCFSSSSSMTNMSCVSVGEEAIVPDSGVAALGASWVSGILVGTMILAMMWRRWRAPKSRVVTRIMHLGALLVFGGLGLASCGSQNLLDALRLPARPTVRTSVPATTILHAGLTYWRVYADDGKGNITASSETRRMDVQ